jgi:hypothetical protein
MLDRFNDGRLGGGVGRYSSDGFEVSAARLRRVSARMMLGVAAGEPCISRPSAETSRPKSVRPGLDSQPGNELCTWTYIRTRADAMIQDQARR